MSTITISWSKRLIFLIFSVVHDVGSLQTLKASSIPKEKLPNELFPEPVSPINIILYTYSLIILLFNLKVLAYIIF